MIRTDITGIGDPYIIRCGNAYYMYATDAPGGFKYFYSEDLIDWKDMGYCYHGTWGENCFWAPEVYAHNGKFYLLYTARMKEKHSLRIGLAVANRPGGPFIDVENGPLFDFDYAAIDATVLFDDDGRTYMYYSRDCSENVIDGVHTSVIYGMEVHPETFKPISKPVVISAPDIPWECKASNTWRWNEGPAVIKRNGIYYLNYSVNCYASREYSIGCSQAVSPLGKFKKYDKPLLCYRENDFSGPGHNNFFTDAKGNVYTAFHIHTNYEKPDGNRRACIAPVRFGEDKKMIIDVDAQVR